MNKFFHPLFLLLTFSIFSTSMYASSVKNDVEYLKFDLCLENSKTKQQDIQHFNYSVADAALLSTNCNAPTILMSGTMVSGNTTGGDLYYQINIPVGQNANFIFAGVPGATLEIINNCISQVVNPGPFCGGGTYLIKISGTTGAFDLTVTAYSNSVTIDILESSAMNNTDGTLCVGEDITLTANPVLNAGTTVDNYSWSSGQATQGFPLTDVTNADAGTYTVTVTDNNMCTTTSSVTVTVNPLPTAVISVSETSGAVDDGEICNGDQATLTASGGNTYVWSNGINNAINAVSPTSTTTYTVTVTDSNGCTDTEQQEIIVNPLPTAGIDIAETSGTFDNDGDICENDPITLTGTGGTTYLWNSSETTEAISPALAVGPHTFTVTVTDANGCTDTHAVSVEVFPAATATILVTEMSGTTANDGKLCLDDQVTLTASGGTGYSWSTGGATAVITDFPPIGMTTYTVTVTDVNGCTASTETTVEVFDLPIADITVADMSADVDDDGLICFGDNATLTATGANGGTYSWSNGSATDAIIVSPAVGQHTYTVTVTDLNGCTDTDMFDIEVFSLPMPTITIAETSGTVNNDGILCAGDDLTLTGVDADPMTMFEWTLPGGTVLMGNPLNITNIDNTFSGVFIVTADNNGCTNTATVNITVGDQPDPEIQFEGSDANFTVCEDEAFDLTVVLTAGMAPYTYSWTLPNGSTGAGSPYSVAAAVEATHEGTWVVTVTDANGCTGTDNIQVTVDPAPANNSCGDAISLGSGTSNISASGDNTCGGTGGGCGVNSESAVYYTYTVPPDGITELVVIVDAPHVVSVSTACGGGGCSNEETIMCPDKGATYYITVSSSEANEGPFNLNVRPTVMTPDITGTLYIDLDASGTFGGNDVGFMGAPMDLLQGCPGGAIVASTTTGADGSYTFGNLAPGSYTVQVSTTSPGAPEGDPSPKECCLIVDPCMPNAVLMCDMGYAPPNCSSNPYSVDNICETAYDNPLCDLRVVGDFACGQNPSELGPWANIAHCGGVYHNTSFYGFVAGSGSYNIEFNIFGCAGTGIQYGLMDACSPGGPYVVCDGSATGNGVTISIPSADLEPCKTYIFWIDGFSASICKYFIHVTGDFQICKVPEIVDLLVDTQCDPLCPINGTVPVTAVGEAGIPALENINGVTLHWDITFPDNSTINLMTNSVDDGLTVDVPFFQVGTYKICVASEHPCTGLNPPFCKEFVVQNIPDTYKEFKVCTADFPWAGAVDPLTGEPELDQYGNQWAWSGGEITLAQIRTDPPSFDWGSLYFNECGCTYTQNLRIIEIGTATGKDSFALCQNELPFTYRDTSFATEFSNLLYKLEGVLSKNGCDSVVNISTRILDYGGTITNECVQGGLEMTFEPSLQFINASFDSIHFAWKNAAGTLMVDNDSDSTNIVVPSAGAYSLVVTVFKYGKSCSFPFTHTIDLTGRLPLAPIADNWPLKICENDSIATYNVLAPDATLTYLWTVPATATKLSDDSTGTIVVRWNGPTGGDICVKARNLCGDSPNTCLPVVFVDMKDPAFNLAIEVCKDNTTPIVATSTHTPPVVYNWDFDGGSPVVPTGNGPGPHDVSWNATVVKTVSLSVSENGCLGKPVTKNIEVKELPAPPVISCESSTVDGVIFEWNANVPGATSYNVNIISFGSGSGSAGPGPNQFQFTGMTTGDCAEIVVVAVIPGPCGNVTSLPVQCCASNCVLPSLSIAPIAPICLIPSTPVVNLTDAMVTVTPPTPGTGSFTVNGTATSVLNPNTLGAGTHTIGYTLVWDGGVCKQSTTSQVTINPTPSSDFTVSPGGCVLDPVTVTYTGGTTGATYTWDFGADVIGSYPGSGPHSVKWTNPGTKTITLSVTKNGCTSTVTTRTVTVNPVLTAPTVSCAEQRIDGVKFGWAPVANASGYQIVVSVVGGAVIYTGIVNVTTFDVPNLPEGTEVTITVTAISNNGCPDTDASGKCKAIACPNAKITFDPKVITECLTPGLAPIALLYDIENNLPSEIPTVTWSSGNPLSNSAINNATNPATFDPQVAKVGSHTLVLTYQQKDCIWKDSMLVVLKPVPVASFTSLDKICISDPLVVTYTGTSTNGRVLNWTNGSAVRSDLTSTTFSFRWSTPGTHQIGLNVSLNGCTSEPFTKTVIVEDTLKSPEISCAESLDKIIFSWTAVPCATEYEVLINGVTKGKQTTRTYTASGLVEGENVQIEIKAISTCECPIAPVKETCTAKACPPVVITLTPSQTSICLVPNVAKITIALDVKGNTPSGKGTWSGVGVDQSGIFDPAVAGLGVHEITYSYDDSNCQYEKKTTISVTQVPQIIWEAVQPKCYSDVSGSFIFQIAGGTAPYKLTMDGNAVSASPVNGVASGNHTFVVTDVNGCTSSQTFTITIPAQPSFEITGAAIVNINDPDATHTLDLAGMAAYLGKIDSIVWVQNGKTICSGSLATCSSVTNKPKLGPNEYSVTIYYNNGCKVTDVFLYVATDQFTWTFPNIINPNSKTGNSKFSIFTSDKSLFVKKMRVYDRWGNQVFIAENFSAYTDPVGWNGRFGGTDVVPGVYVYIFEMTSSSDDNIVETGDVTVIR